MRSVFLSLLIAAAVSLHPAGKAFSEVMLRKSQTVYVPVYSHVLIGDRAMPFNLAVTLILRNTDTKHPVTIISADYFDNDGKLIRRFIGSPLRLNALASTSFFIKETDTTGGLGANFLVKWRAEREVNAPLIESVMIGTRMGQGISFVSSGREVGE